MDKIFQESIEEKFSFNESVASVFDDMLNRSVPYYRDVIKLVVDVIDKNIKDGDRIYDLGSSTAELLLEICRRVSAKTMLVGVDNSEHMIEQAKKKLVAYGLQDRIELLYGDIFDIELLKSKVIVSNYTLQFIRPLNRPKLLSKIYRSLEEGGVFIFSEKVICEDKMLDKQLIDIYHNYKISQGYSSSEIARKREALENVLVPFNDRENRELVLGTNFKSIECIFRWANFSTYVARK